MRLSTRLARRPGRRAMMALRPRPNVPHIAPAQARTLADLSGTMGNLETDDADAPSVPTRPPNKPPSPLEDSTTSLPPTAPCRRRAPGTVRNGRARNIWRSARRVRVSPGLARAQGLAQAKGVDTGA